MLSYKTKAMKLTIKTKDIELDYQDECPFLEDKVKERIEGLIKTLYSAQPTYTVPPVVGTVEEIFNMKKR